MAGDQTCVWPFNSMSNALAITVPCHYNIVILKYKYLAKKKLKKSTQLNGQFPDEPPLAVAHFVFLLNCFCTMHPLVKSQNFSYHPQQVIQTILACVSCSLNTDTSSSASSLTGSNLASGAFACQPHITSSSSSSDCLCLCHLTAWLHGHHSTVKYCLTLIDWVRFNVPPNTS